MVPLAVFTVYLVLDVQSVASGLWAPVQRRMVLLVEEAFLDGGEASSPKKVGGVRHKDGVQCRTSRWKPNDTVPGILELYRLGAVGQFGLR